MDIVFFDIDKKGKKRKYIKFNCDNCNNEIKNRYDAYKKRKNKYCNKCSPLFNEHNFKNGFKHNNYFKPQNGLSKHKLYRVWHSMNKRCYNINNDNYKWYGGKGIIVCDEWKNNFLKFFEYCINNNWKENLEIDRIDSNGNYEPNNVQFITHKENVIRTFENKEKVNKKNVIKCECGSQFIYAGKARHLKTKKHMNYLNNFSIIPINS